MKDVANANFRSYAEECGMQVLTACSLASFSLSDCVLSLLGRTMEIISPQLPWPTWIL